jgi:mannan endo-1,4-beta-mannosidase
MKIKNLIFLAIAASIACSSPRQNVMKTLSEASRKGKFLFAHQDGLSYGKYWTVKDVLNDPVNRSDVKDACGSFPAIAGFDLGGIELGDSANLDSVSFEFMRRAAKKHIERGGLVTISWHMRNPLTEGTTWDVSSNRVVESVLEGGENHQKFMEWLGRGVEFLKSMEGIPIIFRPWHENTADWFWWGSPYCNPEQFRALWALTYEAFKEVDNLIWAFSPTGKCGEEEYMKFYAGDDMVDIVGFDLYQSGFNPDSVEKYIELMQSALEMVSKIAKERGKLYCVAETGLEGVPDLQWWTGTLLKALEGYNPCYVLVWRNAWERPEHYYAPFKDSHDSEDFRSFIASGRVQMLDE